jgi:hypothetical protein
MHFIACSLYVNNPKSGPFWHEHHVGMKSFQKYTCICSRAARCYHDEETHNVTDFCAGIKDDDQTKL